MKILASQFLFISTHDKKRSVKSFDLFPTPVESTYYRHMLKQK